VDLYLSLLHTSSLRDTKLSSEATSPLSQSHYLLYASLLRVLHKNFMRFSISVVEVHVQTVLTLIAPPSLELDSCISHVVPRYEMFWVPHFILRSHIQIFSLSVCFDVLRLGQCG
jgi:hypothetical protein